jgi:tRNA(Arg) A34 adenosine deaminase TadA
MNKSGIEECDRRTMLRAIALSREAGKAGEYPYGALICRGDEVVAESINRDKHDSDVTRHAAGGC